MNKNERLQAALDYATNKLKTEDCIRRIEYHALRLMLENNERLNRLRCWGGDQV